MNVDEDFIRDQVERKINEAHREILERHNIESGDISPSEKIELDKAIDQVVETTRKWVEGRVEKLLYANGGLEAYLNKKDDIVELRNIDTGDSIRLTENELVDIKKEVKE